MEQVRIEWKTDLRGNVLAVTAPMEKESFSGKMLRYNQIEGIVPLELHDIDGTREYRYQIRGLRPMKELLEEKTAGQEQIRVWMEQILICLQIGENYLLKEEDFMIDPAYLFLDGREQVKVCYLEGYSRPINEQLTELCAYWLDRLDYSDSKEVSLAYDLYQCCRDNGGYEEMRRLLRAKPATPGVKRKEEPEVREVLPVITDDPEEEIVPPEEDRRKAAIQAGLMGAAILFAGVVLWKRGLFTNEAGKLIPLRLGLFVLLACAGCLVVMEERIRDWWRKRKEENDFDWGDPEEWNGKDGAKTELLRDQETEVIREFGHEERKLYLEDPEGSRIPVTGLPFTIGKEEQNSLCLDRRTVSRKHAVLLGEGNRYYIRDEGSTNGTRINGDRIDAGEKRELEDGDRIELAREAFVFHCQ